MLPHAASSCSAFATDSPTQNWPLPPASASWAIQTCDMLRFRRSPVLQRSLKLPLFNAQQPYHQTLKPDCKSAGLRLQRFESFPAHFPRGEEVTRDYRRLPASPEKRVRFVSGTFSACWNPLGFKLPTAARIVVSVSGRGQAGGEVRAWGGMPSCVRSREAGVAGQRLLFRLRSGTAGGTGMIVRRSSRRLLDPGPGRRPGPWSGLIFVPLLAMEQRAEPLRLLALAARRVPAAVDAGTRDPPGPVGLQVLQGAVPLGPCVSCVLVHGSRMGGYGSRLTAGSGALPVTCGDLRASQPARRQHTNRAGFLPA
jgi:hypothetical protein